MGILALIVCLCPLQNPINTGMPVTTAVVYQVAIERYPLQKTIAYSVTTTVGRKMEHNTIAVRKP